MKNLIVIITMVVLNMSIMTSGAFAEQILISASIAGGDQD